MFCFEKKSFVFFFSNFRLINPSNLPKFFGIIFIVPVIIVCLCFFKTDFTLAIVSLAVFLAYGVLGFLDDFIKVKYKQNLGLRAYQKIIGQLGISLIVAFFTYNFVGSEVLIPFTDITIDIGIWIIPLIVVTYVATVNSVNLIDGLDGLCSSVSISYLLPFAIILLLSIQNTNSMYSVSLVLIVLLRFGYCYLRI